jgi:hypothetical protein
VSGTLAEGDLPIFPGLCQDFFFYETEELGDVLLPDLLYKIAMILRSR